MRTESILDTTKKLIGSEPDCDDFDADIIVEINSVIGILSQIGVKAPDGFMVLDDTTTWADYLGDQLAQLSMVQSYIAAKVKIAFDPPQNGTLMDSLNRRINELEWRIQAQTNYTPKEEETE